MNKGMFTFQPQTIDETFGPEPSLEHCVRLYYLKHFDYTKADQYTKEYIKAFCKQCPESEGK